MQSWIAHLNDEEGTMALGAALARTLQPGLVIFLHGDLGTGKTCLVRALLHACGHEGHVKSPTYTLVEPYRVKAGGQTVEALHFDLYRMGSPEEFVEAGFREHFDGKSICLVEWPERAAGLLPVPDVEVLLCVSGDGREVKLTANTALGTSCLDRLHLSPNL